MSAPHSPAHTSWHKSSYSTNGGECVEVAEGQNVLVRDSKHPAKGHLPFSSAEWTAFLESARNSHR
jgi:hypothetical protein